MHEIFISIGMVFAAAGIPLFYLKERGFSPSRSSASFLVRKAEYGKILASASATIAVVTWFILVPFSTLNVLLLVAYFFTFPGDFILSRDLTKLLIAIPLYAVAYTLMSVRGLATVFSAMVSVPVLAGCAAGAVVTIGTVLLVVGKKLSPPAFRVATHVYSIIDCVFLFTGLALIFQAFAVLPGIGMVLLVIGDVIAVINIVKPFRNKPAYDLAGGVLYYAGLFALAIYFTL